MENCFVCDVAALSVLQGLSAVLMGSIVIVLHDSIVTIRVIEEPLAVIAVVTSMFWLVITGVRLTGIPRFSCLGTSCRSNRVRAPIEFLADLWTLVVFFLVSSRVFSEQARNPEIRLILESYLALIATLCIGVHFCLFFACYAYLGGAVCTLHESNFPSDVESAATAFQSPVNYVSALELKMQQVHVGK